MGDPAQYPEIRAARGALPVRHAVAAAGPPCRLSTSATVDRQQLDNNMSYLDDGRALAVLPAEDSDNDTMGGIIINTSVMIFCTRNCRNAMTHASLTVSGYICPQCYV